MNTMPQSIFRQLAHARYPKAEIVGDGSWGVLIECFSAKALKLFDTARDAVLAVNVPCGHAHCYLGNHSAVRIKSDLPVEKADDYEDRKFSRRQRNAHATI
jgi:hypothetical protein